jgi:hypothetical protein
MLKEAFSKITENFLVKMKMFPIIVKKIRKSCMVERNFESKAFSSCKLNTSLPQYLHSNPIKLMFYECHVSLFTVGFILRCVQDLSL